MSWTIHEGDCRAVMAAMDADSVDAIVTDPPYGLEFMGKEWDRLGPPVDKRLIVEPEAAMGWQDGNGGNAFSRSRIRNGQGADPRLQQAWHAAWAAEALRVLKPGAHLLAFGGTRTYHRLACALEDAGFEIRDCIAWLYGSGFPKSLDIGKAIDKAAGAEREVLGDGSVFGRGAMGNRSRVDQGYRPTELNPNGGVSSLTAPATDAAREWDGWGTALKPGFEPIVVARKPLGERTVAANVLRYGTGGLNVDGCRLAFASEADEAESKDKNRHADFGTAPGGNEVYGDFSMVERTNYDAPGRWPPNVAMDPEAAAVLDAQTGELKTQNPATRTAPRTSGRRGVTGFSPGVAADYPEELGGASRFFYVAKADRAERDVGLDGGSLWGGEEIAEAGSIRINAPRNEEAEKFAARRNSHPTVKPIALMRWLCRLVTPKGGTVLDPFTGSGTTGIAALAEGFTFVGIEREADYVRIARRRIGAGSPVIAPTPDPVDTAP